MYVNKIRARSCNYGIYFGLKGRVFFLLLLLSFFLSPLCNGISYEEERYLELNKWGDPKKIQCASAVQNYTLPTYSIFPQKQCYHLPFLLLLLWTFFSTISLHTLLFYSINVTFVVILEHVSDTKNVDSKKTNWIHLVMNEAAKIICSFGNVIKCIPVQLN